MSEVILYAWRWSSDQNWQKSLTSWSLHFGDSRNNTNGGDGQGRREGQGTARPRKTPMAVGQGVIEERQRLGRKEKLRKKTQTAQGNTTEPRPHTAVISFIPILLLSLRTSNCIGVNIQPPATLSNNPKTWKMEKFIKGRKCWFREGLCSYV